MSITSTMIEMIFEIGFNYCCRNFFGNTTANGTDNLNIKFSANLLNETTNVTENCVVEYSGEWAKILSFIVPGMDMKIVAKFPNDSSEWNNCVVVKNLSCPEPVEVRYEVDTVSIVEEVGTLQTGRTASSRRLIVFDKNRKITTCKLIGGSTSGTGGAATCGFPNYWMSSKRHIVDRDLNAFRPLTTITQDVPVINVIVGFISNSPPGAYKFSHPTDPYVRTHVHVSDMSYRNLKLSAIRTANDDMRDVPAFHLHLQIDKADVNTSALPWLTVGDVLMVHTVKPVFAQKQAWNLLWKQKKFGQSNVKIWRIDSVQQDSGVAYDLEGNIVERGSAPPPAVVELQSWFRHRLTRDSLISANHQGNFAHRDIWIAGCDIVCEIKKVNRYTCSLFVSDGSRDEIVEVRVRTSQQRINESMEYLFSRLEQFEAVDEGHDFAPTATQTVTRRESVYVLLRNVRTANDGSVFCSLEHVTRVPEFCFDVQQLHQRQQSLTMTTKSQITDTNTSVVDGQGFGFSEMIPNVWQEPPKPAAVEKTSSAGCVDASSQIQFEYVEDTQYTDDGGAENSENSPLPNDTQCSEEMSQLYPRKLKFDARDVKKQRMGE